MKRITTVVEETNEQYQVKFSGDIHKVDQVIDSYRAITHCGESFLIDATPLLQGELITCDRCFHLRVVSFTTQELIIRDEDDNELYTASSFQDARQWCYRHKALGFSVRNGKVITKIYWSKE